MPRGDLRGKWKLRESESLFETQGEATANVPQCRALCVNPGTGISLYIYLTRLGDIFENSD